MGENSNLILVIYITHYCYLGVVILTTRFVTLFMYALNLFIFFRNILFMKNDFVDKIRNKLIFSLCRREWKKYIKKTYFYYIFLNRIIFSLCISFSTLFYSSKTYVCFIKFLRKNCNSFKYKLPFFLLELNVVQIILMTTHINFLKSNKINCDINFLFYLNLN